MNLQEQLNRIHEMIHQDTNEGLMSDLKSFFTSKRKKYDDEETRFTCQDCGDKDYKMYMVNDDIWQEYGNDSNTLCMSCLEKRMGRKLTKDDFTDHKKALANQFNPDVQDLFNNPSDINEDVIRIKEVMNLFEQEIEEDIDAKEAYSNYGSIKTIIDGKRNIAFVQLNPKLNLMIKFYGLKKLKVESNNNFIVYRKEVEQDAKELLSIANKYGGFLHYQASEDDTRRIGQLLGYKESDIEDYINQKK